jgi:hypothetical protein
MSNDCKDDDDGRLRLEHMNEADKILLILAAEDIGAACVHKCQVVRKTYSCPNDQCCRLQFNVDLGPKAVEILRRSLWKPSENMDQTPTCTERRRRLITRLEAMASDSDSGQRYIKYELNGVHVCKDFFKVVS